MNFIHKSLSILCFSVGLFSLSHQAQANDALDNLKAFMKTTKTLKAEFSQTVMAGKSGKPQTSSGVAIFSRPGKFSWQIEYPYRQTLVSDGKKVWIYDPDLKQVTVKKIETALGGTPAALLADEESLEKSFTLKAAGERAGLQWVEALPKSTESGFEKINIGLSGADLKAMELFDNFGQTTLLNFSNLERNIPLAPATFSFTPPEGVDVIGE